MSFFKEIRDIYRYFKNSNRQNVITFYSEMEIYYQYYKGTIEALLLKSNTIICTHNIITKCMFICSCFRGYCRQVCFFRVCKKRF